MYARTKINESHSNILTGIGEDEDPVLPHGVTNKESKDDDDIELTGVKRTHHTSLQREIRSLNTTTAKVRDSRARDSGNRIIHWDSLKTIIDYNLCCKVCGGDICLADTTTGIATEINLSCKNVK